MSAPKYKLVYFNGTGRAQSIRLTFAAGGVPFEDSRVGYPEFQALCADKAKCPLQCLPLLFADDRLIGGNSHCIRHFAARLAHLTHEDPMDNLRIDEVEYATDELLSLHYKCMFERDAEKKKVNTHEFHTSGFQHYAAYIESILARGAASNQFITATLSQADIFLFCVLQYVRKFAVDENAISVDATTLLAGYPRILALESAVKSVPAIAAAIVTYPF